MFKHWLSVLLILICILAANAVETPFGTIDFMDGDVTVIRSGKTYDDMAIGDFIFVNDMIKTEEYGTLVINLDKRTGMRGNLTVKSGSAVYIRLTDVQKSPKTTLELMAGSVSSKVSKLSGSPTMQVKTQIAAMGVRGTEFGVASSVNGSIMVWCSEGLVECSDETDTIEIEPGKAVSRRPMEKLRLFADKITSYEEFEKNWFNDEISIFRAGGIKLLIEYESKYRELLSEFDKQYNNLRRLSVLKKWIKQEESGDQINPLDPSVLKEKKEIIGSIMSIRKTLFILERIFYRLEQIDVLLSNTAAEKLELRKGVKVMDFFRKFRADRKALILKIAFARYAEKLFESRNQNGLLDDDFFGSF